MKLEQKTGVPFKNSHYFKQGDYKIHYRVDEAHGKEKAKMFLIHGFGCDTEFFDEVVKLYTKKGIKCVRVDLPDFGFSTRELKGIKYVPQVDLLLALMKKLDKDKSGWILVGHSMGGSVSLELAMKDSSMLNAIILNAPLLMFNVPGWMGKLIMLKPMRNLMDKALQLVVNWNWFFKLMECMMTFNPVYTMKFDTQKFSAPFSVDDTGAGLCYMTSKTHCPDIKQLDLKIPVQLVTGRLDLFVFPTKAKALSNALPESADRHKLLGGHCFLQDRAKATAKLALTFLKSNDLL